MSPRAQLVECVIVFTRLFKTRVKVVESFVFTVNLLLLEQS